MLILDSYWMVGQATDYPWLPSIRSGSCATTTWAIDCSDINNAMLPWQWPYIILLDMMMVIAVARCARVVVRNQHPLRVVEVRATPLSHDPLWQKGAISHRILIADGLTTTCPSLFFQSLYAQQTAPVIERTFTMCPKWEAYIHGHGWPVTNSMLMTPTH